MAELRYRPDIDGLRAIAVLSVIACHAGIPRFAGGFIGVDVFFVISGYLITGLLQVEWEAQGRISLTNFFARRVRRLLPALLLITVTTLVIGLLTMFPQELPRLGKSASALLFLSANIHFLSYSGGYFDPSTDVMPFLHTWSLSVEEQYYLVWPLLLLCSTFAVRRWKAPRSLPVVLLGAIAILSLAAFLAVSRTRPAEAFYLVHLRGWEFAFGGLAMFAARRFRLAAGTGQALALFGLAGILAAVTLIDDSIAFPGWVAVVPVIGSSLVLFGLSRTEGGIVRRLLASRLLVRIGLISYSLYLWHWPLLALTRAYFLGQRNPLYDSAAVVLAFALAALTYRWVEVPIRYRKPGWFGQSQKTLLAGALLSFGALLAAQGVIHWGKHSNAVLNDQLLQAESDLGFFASCHAEGGALAPRDACLVGGANPTVLVWGDSHAGQLREMFGARPGSSLFRIQASCLPIANAAPVIKGVVQDDCARFNTNVLAEFRQHPGIKGIVLAARWNTYLAQPVTDPGGITSYGLTALPPVQDSNAQDPKQAAAMLETGLRELLTAIGPKVHVALIAPVPEMYFHVPQCLHRRSPERCTIPRARVEERRLVALGILRRIAADYPNLRLIDPIQEFCDASSCASTGNGLVRYSDDNHVSLAMARHLARAWRRDLDWIDDNSEQPENRRTINQD